MGINSLNISVAALSKELHQDGLAGLGLVNDGLGADLEAANILGGDVVLGEETLDR